MHGIGQKQAGQSVARRLLFGLHRGVALQLGLADERQERQHKLVERRDGRMREDGGLLGIDARGQVVHDHVVHVVLDVLGGVAVGDHLVVGDEHVALDAQVLVFHAVLDAAEVMPQMQAARGAVAGEHRVLIGMLRQVSANIIGALLARQESIGIFRHVCFSSVLENA